jgi:hypothetical protein
MVLARQESERSEEPMRSALAACLAAGLLGCGTTGSGTDGGNRGDLAGGGSCATQCMPPFTCGKSGQCIPPGGCATIADCQPGEQCVAGDGGDLACVPGGCGGTKLTADAVPPNLLVALDRSCSMTQSVGATTKWQIAVNAINTLTMMYQGKIQFGLTMFPDTDADQCNQGAIPVPPGPGNEARIQQLLTAALQNSDANYPKGPCVTPIDTGMLQSSMAPALADKTRGDFVVLITDGAQAGCSAAGGATGAANIITQMAQAGIGTFVIGFGGQVNAKQLNSFAVAGGHPTGVMSKEYYDAADQMSLDAALQTIASQTFGCVYKLQTVPPDPQQVYSFFDRSGVMRDPSHANGWDYDPTTNTVTFYGAACTQLRSGTVTVLDIVFGCDAPPG